MRAGKGLPTVVLAAMGVLLSLSPALAHAQGGGGLDLGLGGIPYTPWLVPATFVTGGITWSVFGWYTSTRTNDFDWRRFGKTVGAGAGVGIMVFATAGSHDVGSVTHALLAGEDHTVGPSEIVAANLVTTAIVGAAHTSWKKIRGSIARPEAQGAQA